MFVKIISSVSITVGHSLETLKRKAHEMAKKLKHFLISKLNQNKLYFPFPVWDNQVIKITAAYIYIFVYLSENFLQRLSLAPILQFFCHLGQGDHF